MAYPDRHKVLVNTRDAAFRGVLWAQRGAWLVLRNVDMLKPGGEAQPVDGELVLPRERVDFMQVF